MFYGARAAAYGARFARAHRLAIVSTRAWEEDKSESLELLSYDSDEEGVCVEMSTFWDSDGGDEGEDSIEGQDHSEGFPTIYVIHDNAQRTQLLKTALTSPSLYAYMTGTQAGQEECTHLPSLSVVDCDISRGRAMLLDLALAPPHGVFLNRVGASSSKDHRDCAAEIVAWLQSAGRTVLSGSAALALDLR